MNNINLIRLQGYKSVANATVEEATPFAVLAGPNGSGKSNLADGLAFFGTVVAQGAKQAIRQFGGYNQMHCYKFKKEKARTVSLELKLQLDGSAYHYFIKIYQLDTTPQLEEKLIIDGEVQLQRERGDPPGIRPKPDQLMIALPYPDDMSGLNMFPFSPIRDFMTNIRVFRFDPLGAKEPDMLSADATELDTHGRNVATMLSVLEKKAELREQILEWIELLVPGMEKVKTEQQKLDGRTIIKFKEEGMKTFLPANLISDGTIYALCILTAVLSRAKGQGMTIIEEPERGIHPQAIAELVSLMRANASPEHPVWVTTHSESVVRSATADELWLINKVDGKTELKNAGKNSVPLGNMNLDKAWLMNFFDGGLPW
ncbi:MAG: ABC transporter ATP-binding protein [Thiothrix lacustris]|uniref:ABC transporter ATP-binding protein n=1 Tax=Thiothrix lacustris TaxID=525917 RepID=A0A1Y1QCF8_9GAMM|nr:MAG: ABC transporter ATP-binding protein [Thiothrix lacustris]